MSRLPSNWDAPKRYGLCPECGRKVSVTKEGRLRAHEPRTYRALSRVSPFGRGNCAGQTPVDTELQKTQQEES